MTDPRRERARALSPDERRAALIEATLPLLPVHGRAVTSRQIAEAAGVAEGTIFRVFESKDALVDAAVAKAFEAGQMLEDIRAIPLGEPLRDRTIALVTLLQNRFREMFALMHAIGMVGPPDRGEHSAAHAERVRRTLDAMAEVIEPDTDSLTVSPLELVRLLRLLTFSGSHPKFTDGAILPPAQIVDTVLYGVVERKER